MDPEKDRLNAAPVRVGIVLGSLEAGGAQRMALELARGLLAGGDDVRLICIDRDRAMALSGDAAEQAALEARLVVLGRSRVSAGTLPKALAFPARRRALDRVVARDRLDVVISFMERANLLSLAGRRGPPRILSIRKHIGQGLAGKSALKRTLVRLGYPLLLRRAAAVTFNARASADDFIRRFPVPAERVHVIPNSVDPAILRLADEADPDRPEGSPERSPERSNGSVRTIVTAGRLVPVKAHALLLRAFARVARSRPDLRLVIVGDGPLRADLEALATRLGVAAQTRFTGFRPNPYPWMAGADVFVLPSRAEGFPNALLEALCLGRAAVAADCPSGPRELLAPDTPPDRVATTVETAAFGLLVPPLPATDPAPDAPLHPAEAALADALARLLDDATLRHHYAQQAAQRAADFTPDAVLAHWRALIRTVIRQDRPAS